jgi:hypothetical protein
MADLEWNAPLREGPDPVRSKYPEIFGVGSPTPNRPPLETPAAPQVVQPQAARAEQSAPAARTAPAPAPSGRVFETTDLPQSAYEEMPWLEALRRAGPNVLPSMGNEAAAAYNAVANDPSGTWEYMKQAGSGAASKVRGVFGGERDMEAEAATDALISSITDKYQSSAAFKEAMVENPASILLDAASVAPVVGMTGRAAGLGRVATGIEKVASLGDPVNLALQTAKLGTQAVTRPAAFASRVTQGIASGTPQASLSLAAQAGRSRDPLARAAFRDFASGKGDPRDIARAAMAAMEEKKRIASDFYTSRRRELTTQELPMSEIRNALDDALRNADPYGLRSNAADVAALREMDNLIRGYEMNPNSGARTAVQLDRLKRDLRNIVKQLGPSEQGGVSAIPNAVRDTIAKVDPTYAQMMDYWQEWMGKMRDLQSTLGTGDRVSETARIGKLMSTMKKGEKMSLLKELADTPSGKYLPYMIAGSTVQDLLPPSLQAFGMAGLGSVALGGLHGIGAAALASPKLAGMTQYGLGRLEGAINAIPKPPAALTNVAAQIGSTLPPEEERVGRKSGGRVGVNHDSLADQLVGAAERAKKGISKGTEQLLDLPDDHIAHALEVANRSI